MAVQDNETVAAYEADSERSDVRAGDVPALSPIETVADADFDRLTALAAAVSGSPAALLALADARYGMMVRSHFGVEASTALAVLRQVELSAGKPELSDSDGRLPFLFEMPIFVSGLAAGKFLVFGPEPRLNLEAGQIEQLKALAEIAASLIALRDRSHAGARAEAALFHAETRRAIALEAAALASWVWNPRSGSIECDALLPQLFNLPAATRMRARDVLVAIDRRDIGKTRALFQEALAGSDDYSGEYRIRGIDPPRWLAARGRVVERDASGKPTLVFGVNYDITERRATEERQRFLLRELNHRVKNTLATVQALATQTVRHAREPREFLDAFSERLRALGLAHGLLSEHEWRGIGIRELTRVELTPFDEADAPRIAILGQDALLTPDQALGLALILHELASNALKYGALSVSAGRVSVSWIIQGSAEGKRLVLDWTESGGPVVSPPSRHGFGSILIRRSLAKVISSEVRHEYLPEGVRARISMPFGQPGGH